MPHAEEYYINFNQNNIGLNLLPNRSNRGVYVSGFYRSPDGKILEGEASEHIQPGDHVVTVATHDVTKLTLDDISDMIKQSSRPLTIKFRKRVFPISQLISFQNVMKNEAYRNIYIQFCKRIGLPTSVNRIQFYLELQQFKDLPESEQPIQASLLIDKYLKPHADYDLGIKTAFNTIIEKSKSEESEKGEKDKEEREDIEEEGEDNNNKEITAEEEEEEEEETVKKVENPIQELLWAEGSTLKALQNESFGFFILSEEYKELRLSFEKVINSPIYTSYMLLDQIEKGNDPIPVSLYNEVNMFIIKEEKEGDSDGNEIHDKGFEIYKKYIEEDSTFKCKILDDEEYIKNVNNNNRNIVSELTQYFMIQNASTIDKDQCLLLYKELLEILKVYIYDFIWADFTDSMMFERLCKDLNIICIDNYDDYFQDYSTKNTIITYEKHKDTYIDIINRNIQKNQLSNQNADNGSSAANNGNNNNNNGNNSTAKTTPTPEKPRSLFSIFGFGKSQSKASVSSVSKTTTPAASTASSIRISDDSPVNEDNGIIDYISVPEIYKIYKPNIKKPVDQLTTIPFQIYEVVYYTIVDSKFTVLYDEKQPTTLPIGSKAIYNYINNNPTSEVSIIPFIIDDNILRWTCMAIVHNIYDNDKEKEEEEENNINTVKTPTPTTITSTPTTESTSLLLKPHKTHVIGIISNIPSYPQLHSTLSTFYQKNSSILFNNNNNNNNKLDSNVKRLLDELLHYDLQYIPFPLSNGIPYLRCPLTYLFSHVSIDTIIDSYISLITETNLIYISGKYTSLCYVLEGLISLLFPLKWNHIYYSVATTKIVDNLLFTNIYAKIPYLIGIIPNNSEYNICFIIKNRKEKKLLELPCNIVNLHTMQNNFKLLKYEKKRELKTKILYPSHHSADSFHPQKTDWTNFPTNEILSIFYEFTLSFIDKPQNYSFVIMNKNEKRYFIFDKSKFIKNNTHSAELETKISRTTTFQNYICDSL